MDGQGHNGPSCVNQWVQHPLQAQSWKIEQLILPSFCSIGLWWKVFSFTLGGWGKSDPPCLFEGRRLYFLPELAADISQWDTPRYKLPPQLQTLPPQAGWGLFGYVHHTPGAKRQWHGKLQPLTPCRSPVEAHLPPVPHTHGARWRGVKWALCGESLSVL